MLTWTLAFVSVVATAALLRLAASWDGIFLAGRISFIVFVALALLTGGRSAIRRMARPWEDATSRSRPPARRPYVDVARVRDHPAGKREGRRPAALQFHASRAPGEGRDARLKPGGHAP